MAICKRVCVVAVVAAVGVASFARAQETVEDRKAVLDAQIDLLKKQAEVNKLLRDVAGSSAMGLPVVLSTSEVGGVRMARLQLANGNAGYFREGEMVQNGVAISSIAGDRVFARIGSGKGAKAILLDFASRVPGTPGAPNQANTSTANDALLPQPPAVKVPAIDVLPTPRQGESKSEK